MMATPEDDGPWYPDTDDAPEDSEDWVCLFDGCPGDDPRHCRQRCHACGHACHHHHDDDGLPSPCNAVMCPCDGFEG